MLLFSNCLLGFSILYFWRFVCFSRREGGGTCSLSHLLCSTLVIYFHQTLREIVVQTLMFIVNFVQICVKAKRQDNGCQSKCVFLPVSMCVYTCVSVCVCVCVCVYVCVCVCVCDCVCVCVCVCMSE